MRINMPVTDRNKTLPENTNILSTTDKSSKITSVNQEFIDICGFSEQELVDQPHNIIRHPDMPPAAFADLWQKLKSGKSWMGMVKNRCKNGDHYWVNAFVTPIISEGREIEYQSVRTHLTAEQIAKAEAFYKQLRAGQKPLAWRLPAIGLSGKLLWLTTLLIGLISVVFTWVDQLPWLPMAGMALTTAIIVAIANYWLLRPYRRLAAHSRSVTDNPLSQWLYTGRHDDLGAIEFAMKMYHIETSAVIGRLSESSKQLNQHTDELVDAVDHGLQSSAQQLAETDQVATAVTEMTASIKDVAENALHAAQAADQADQETTLGQQQVERTSHDIAALATQLQQAQTVIRQLEERSGRISAVLEVITTIAEQTNLLALNAAIEAARAGTAGRGFAVVADEVRNLAARTQQSTQEIQVMISELQQGSAQAVDVMQQSHDQVDGTVAQAEKAAQALREIKQRVNQITEMTAHIAAAVDQQGTVSSDIDRSINAIHSNANAHVTALKANHSSTVNLAQQTDALKALVAQFWSRQQHS